MALRARALPEPRAPRHLRSIVVSGSVILASRFFIFTPASEHHAEYRSIHTPVLSQERVRQSLRTLHRRQRPDIRRYRSLGKTRQRTATYSEKGRPFTRRSDQGLRQARRKAN